MKESTGPYNPIVMDHFKHPRNMGEMENPDGMGEAQNPVCGDTMRLFIRVESDRIVDATFLTFGCSAAIASSSLTTEMIKGKTMEEALQISDEDIINALGGLPPSKVHCSILAEMAIQAAVEDYREKSRLKLPPPLSSPIEGEGI
ncbi:MAG: iron-sulfur cluster assembly scaffold protein [Deltaproteobacteria bacterium]|nr:iron-sulfur cluster assembly scaffold protein [Deltaproteobacteria bacterium]